MVRRGLLLLAAAGLGAAAPSQAAIVVADFAGVIVSGTDIAGADLSSGLFTANAGTDLQDYAIFGRVRYDTDAFTPDGSGIYGGDFVTNFIDFEITIAGTTYSFEDFAADNDFQFAYVENDGADPIYGPDQFNLNLARDGAPGVESISLLLGGEEFLIGNDLPLAFTFMSVGEDNLSNVSIATTAGIADAFFRVTCASTTAGVCPTAGSGPAVPEPSTWAMLIAGFGAVGGAMRRKTRIRLADA